MNALELSTVYRHQMDVVKALEKISGEVADNGNVKNEYEILQSVISEKQEKTDVLRKKLAETEIK